MIRAFLGGMRNEALLAENDNALVAIVRHELIDILGETVVGIGLDPEYTQVTRWLRAMAQYAVGHQERMERISERVAALPGLRLAGNADDGIGISDCIRPRPQGRIGVGERRRGAASTSPSAICSTKRCHQASPRGAAEGSAIALRVPGAG